MKCLTHSSRREHTAVTNRGAGASRILTMRYDATNTSYDSNIQSLSDDDVVDDDDEWYSA